MFGISIWQLLIILAIIILLFGAKKIRHLGRDMGEMVRGFRGAVKEIKDDNDEKT